MRICTTIEETRAATRRARQQGQRVGLVPTMGALHEGHLSLVRRGKSQTDFVAVSLFVNPLQFGPNEDRITYPRTFDRDRSLLEPEGVNLLFAPSDAEMYPGGAATFVEVGGLGDRLDGQSRPGHFRGVTTVVSKLFHIVEPDLACFGQKDAAQVAIIRRMVRDLNLPVEIVVCPIVRERDGLAMSSRNAYLNSEQRRQALVLSKSLQRIEHVFRQGERDSGRLIAEGKGAFAEEPSVRLVYLSIVDPDSLEPLNQTRSGALVAVAAYVGTTRLIDNVVLGS